MPLPSCFLTTSAGVFGFGTGDGFCLPAATAPTESALPLPSCFLASIAATFSFGTGDGICLPAAIVPELVESVLPLPPCFLASIATIFVFGASEGIGLPAAIVPELVERAQQGERVRRVGALMSTAGDDPEGQARIAAFQQGLQEFGWSTGLSATKTNRRCSA